MRQYLDVSTNAQELDDIHSARGAGTEGGATSANSPRENLAKRISMTFADQPSCVGKGGT